MRYFLISIVIHVVLLSFIWTGFSVPSARKQNTFTYLGELVSVSQEYSRINVSHQVDNDSDAIILGENSSASFEPWLKMRQVEKPR